jgi:hypothetical protein
MYKWFSFRQLYFWKLRSQHDLHTSMGRDDCQWCDCYGICGCIRANLHERNTHMHEWSSFGFKPVSELHTQLTCIELDRLG